jgi:uncharacterized repeat protein (TIGR03803 family)
MPARFALTATLTCLSLLTLSSSAQTYKFFSVPPPRDGFGITPMGRVSRNSSKFYGTTAYTNPESFGGAVLEFTASGGAKVLYNFGRTGGGGYPDGAIIFDQAGNLYGPMYFGGLGGAIFRIDTLGNESIFYDFQGSPDGLGPSGNLTQDSAGNVYGTTLEGGLGTCFLGCGTVFRVDPDGNEVVLYSFQGGADGQEPTGGLVRDSVGNLYGTTTSGGSGGFGTVFKVDPEGSETVLYSFQGGADGADPFSGLAVGPENALYGSTSEGGGACDCGVIFKIDTAGAETIIYRFTGGADGASPEGGLVLDAAGNMYGTAVGGGEVPCSNVDYFSHGCGTVFEVSQDGIETTLHAFHLSDGAQPATGLLRDKSGILYGNTMQGGSGTCHQGNPFLDGCGVFFAIVPSPSKP